MGIWCRYFMGCNGIHVSLYHVIQCWYQYTMIYREQKSLKASERLREMFQFLHSCFLHNLYQFTMFRHFKSVPAIWLYLSATFFQWVPCAVSSTIPCRRWYNSSVGWDLLNRLMKFLNISSDSECCRHVKHSLHIGFDIKSWHGKIRPDTSFRPTSLLGLRNARMTHSVLRVPRTKRGVWPETYCLDLSCRLLIFFPMK